PSRSVPIEYVERDNVGGERVPREHAFVEEAIEEVFGRPARVGTLLALLGRSLDDDRVFRPAIGYDRFGNRVKRATVGDCGIDGMQRLVDKAGEQGISVDCCDLHRKPSLDASDEVFLVLSQPRFEVITVQRGGRIPEGVDCSKDLEQLRLFIWIDIWQA